MVPGGGSFGGLVFHRYRKIPAKRHDLADDEERIIVLTLLYVYQSQNRDGVAVLGNADVPGDWAEYDSKDDPVRYETTRPEWYHLESNGDLYVIVRRGPKNPAIVVYKLALKEEVRERLRAIDPPARHAPQRR